MIVVDSSVWIDYFSNPLASLSTVELHLFNEPNIAVIPVITLKVLAGFKKEESFQKVRTIFKTIKCLNVPEETYTHAASLYRKLRTKRLTIRSPIDCLIAQVAIENDAELLSLDRDFYFISKQSSLKLIKPEKLQ